MADQYVLPAAVTAPLNALQQRLRMIAVVRGVGVFLLLSCGLLVALLLSDLSLDLEAGTRSGALILLALAEVLAAALLIGRPLWRQFPVDEVAALAEHHFPQLKQRIISLVEFAGADASGTDAGSTLMRELLEQDTVREISKYDFDEAVSAKPAMRRMFSGLAAVTCLALTFLVFPAAVSLLLARLFVPWGNFATVSRLHFEIDRGDRVVARGDDVAVFAKITWRSGNDEPVPEPVTLTRIDRAGGTDSRSLRFEPKLDGFLTTIPDVQDGFEFQITAGGNRSERFRIDVVDPPRVVEASLEISPPGYLGRPRKVIDGAVGEMAVFEHSRLRFSLTFNKPVTSAAIDWIAPMVASDGALAGVRKRPAGASGIVGDKHIGAYVNDLLSLDDLPDTVLTMASDRRSATLEMPAQIQAAFEFKLTDEHGLANRDEPFRQFLLTRDQPPQLDAPGPAQDEAQPADVYPLAVTVTDDVGVEAFELHVTSEAGPARIVPIAADQLGEKSIEHVFRVDLADLELKPNEILKLQVRAADGRPEPGPNEIWSVPRFVAVRANASAPGSREVLARQAELRKELRELQQQLQTNVARSDELAAEAQRDLERDREFAGAGQIQQLAETESEVAERLRELSAQLAGHPLFERLANDVQDVAANDVQPAADRLEQSVDVSARQQVESLQQNSEAADIAAERLSELASRFEELAQLEQDLLELGRIAERANQLADDSEELLAQRDTLRDAASTRQPEVTQPAQDDRAANDPAANELAANEPAANEPAANGPDSEQAAPVESASGDAAENELASTTGNDPASEAARAAAERELQQRQQQLLNEQTDLLEALDALLAERPELIEAARDHQLERLARLAEQARELAEPQQRLADALAADALADDALAADATRNQSESEQPADPSREPSTPDASLDDLRAQQNELAAEAAGIALAARQQLGGESPAAQSATQSAENGQKASESADSAQLGDAAQQARAAAAAANSTAEQLLAADAPALADRALDVASQQEQLAEQFEQLAGADPRRAAAQQARQEQLAQAAAELAGEFAELADRLSQEPLNLAEPGANAQQAQASAERSEQAAQQAAQNLKADNAQAAAGQAQQAAQQLRDAANQATGQPVQNGEPATGEPATGQPATGQPATGEPASSDPATGTPSNSEPTGSNPQNGAAANRAAPGSEPPGNRPEQAGSNRQTVQPARDTPGSSPPAGQAPASAQPASGETPSGQPAASETPGGETPASAASENQSASGETPNGQPANNRSSAIQPSNNPEAGTPSPSRQPGSESGAPAQSDRSAIPGELATQVTDALRQLQRAQQQLAAATAESALAGQPGSEPPRSAQPGATSESGTPSGQPAGSQGPPGEQLAAAEPGSGEPAAGQAALNAADGSQAELPGSDASTSGSESASGNASTPSPGQSGAASRPNGAANNAARPASPPGPPSEPGQSGQPDGGNAGDGEPGGDNGTPSNAPNGAASGQRSPPSTGHGQSLVEASQSLKQAAGMLSSAARQLTGAPSETSTSSTAGQATDQGGLANNGDGAGFEAADLTPLDARLQRQAMKNWGRLPGKLQTEILDASRRKLNGDYSKQIKLYFEDVARAGQQPSSK